MNVLSDAFHAEEAARVKQYRYKGYYSLDLGDGIERAVIRKKPTLAEIRTLESKKARVHAALATLSDIQARRIYAKHFLDLTVPAIAKAEGVAEQNVRKSIKRGMTKMKKFLEK